MSGEGVEFSGDVVGTCAESALEEDEIDTGVVDQVNRFCVPLTEILASEDETNKSPPVNGNACVIVAFSDVLV